MEQNRVHRRAHDDYPGCFVGSLSLVVFDGFVSRTESDENEESLVRTVLDETRQDWNGDEITIVPPFQGDEIAGSGGVSLAVNLDADSGLGYYLRVTTANDQVVAMEGTPTNFGAIMTHLLQSSFRRLVDGAWGLRNQQSALFH